jgi:acetyl esterase/lipase
MSKPPPLLSVSDYLAFPIVTAVHRIPYGNDQNQFVDLFLPEQKAAKYPVVFLIHGGCWQAAFGLAQLGQLAHALTEHGIAVCNIEYRRLGNGGGWPTTFTDVAAAADSLRELSAEYPLDLTRVVTVGHSAGGHLALWLACRRQLASTSTLYIADPLPIKAVVSLAGIPDMETAVQQSICQEAPKELMGGRPKEQPTHYAEGSPSSFLPLGLPHIYVSGEQDSIVPFDYIQNFVTAAKISGDPAQLIPVKQAGHFEIVATNSHAWPLVRNAILGVI